MKVYELATMCQNQWRKDEVFKLNENFKLEIRLNEKTYKFDINYNKEDDYICYLRDKLVLSFWIEDDTLYILAA